jgi:hypothetical protein
VLRQNRRRREEWHVDWSEIELGEAIGMGRYGEVYRGTEVAVKLVANTQTTKDRPQLRRGGAFSPFPLVSRTLEHCFSNALSLSLNHNRQPNP